MACVFWMYNLAWDDMGVIPTEAKVEVKQITLVINRIETKEKSKIEVEESKLY
jgi:hypothetical protein